MDLEKFPSCTHRVLLEALFLYFQEIGLLKVSEKSLSEYCTVVTVFKEKVQFCSCATSISFKGACLGLE